MFLFRGADFENKCEITKTVFCGKLYTKNFIQTGYSKARLTREETLQQKDKETKDILGMVPTFGQSRIENTGRIKNAYENIIRRN